MSTINFATVVTFSTRFFKISQPTNSNYEYRISAENLRLEIHTSLPNVFYMNEIPLDYTLISSPVGASRAAMITAIEALAGIQSVSVTGPVAISGTVTTTIVPAATQGMYTIRITGNNIGSQSVIAIKVNSASPTAKVVLASMSAATSAALSLAGGVDITLNKNPTVTGGTFNNFSTSIVQTNTTFSSVAGGTDIYGLSFKQSTGNHKFDALNMTFLNNDILVITLNNGGIATSNIYLNFMQNT